MLRTLALLLASSLLALPLGGCPGGDGPDAGDGDGDHEPTDGGAAADGGSFTDGGAIGGDGDGDGDGDGGGGPTDAGEAFDGGPPGDAGALDEDGGATTPTVIRVHYDAGFGSTIALRGELPLSWDSDDDAEWTPGDVWEWSTHDLTGPIEVKPVLRDGSGDLTWPPGPNWILEPGTTLDVYPVFPLGGAAVGGRVETVSVPSAYLGAARTTEIWLPPSYDDPGAVERTYPVLVMQDGQNLFDDDAIQGGWRLADSLDALTLFGHAGAFGDEAPVGAVVEVIVVGPHNGGSARLWEYTPTAGELGPDLCGGEPSCGGEADVYLDFVEEELLPYVRQHYRADEGPVGIGGSSLGGLVSLYACWTRPAAFDRCGVFSPSLWWDDNALLAEIAADPGPKRPHLLYLDAGTSSDGLGDVQLLAADLLGKPAPLAYTWDEDLRCLAGAGHGHNEPAWKRRSPFALAYLYGDPHRAAAAPTPLPEDLSGCLP